MSYSAGFISDGSCAVAAVFPDNYYVTVVGVTAALHAILAVSLNLLMGYAGQISLGHAGIFRYRRLRFRHFTTRYGWNPGRPSWPAWS